MNLNCIKHCLKKKNIKETQTHTEQVDSGSNGLVKF